MSGVSVLDQEHDFEKNMCPRKEGKKCATFRDNL